MNKAIKYRIYPTAEQAVLFAKTFGCCRKVYNLMLETKTENYQKTGHFGQITPAAYKTESLILVGEIILDTSPEHKRKSRFSTEPGFFR